MAEILAKEWARMRKGLKPAELCHRVSEAYREKHLDPMDFDLREAAEGLIEDGREFVAAMNPRREMMVSESANVNTALFSFVTKSVISQRVMDSFNMEEFVLNRLIPTVKSDVQGEVIPGVQGIGDKAEIVGEAEFYPTVTFAEDWERSPIAFKKGMTIPVTREAVFFNRTGQILKMAAMVGEWLGVHREKEIADTIIDNPRGSATGGMGNRLNWQGTLYATYDTGTNWTNSHANPLINYQDVEQAETLFDNMLDPWTGEPITLGGTQILGPTAMRFKIAELATADSIVNITGSATVENRFPNPLKGLTAATSRILYRRIINGGNAGTAVSASNAAQYWYYGDLRRAFEWIEHWPLVVEQLGAGSWLDWTQDILVAYKTRYYGTAATRQPRVVVRNTN